MAAEIRAGIDIGTNTILLLIAKVENGRLQEVLHDEVRIVRLGQGVDESKLFHPDAITRGDKCFQEYAEILSNYPAVVCRAVATSASRDVKNAAAFFQEIKDKYNISVNVISGEEEALLSFRGSLAEKENFLDYVVVDIGGGSTEFVTQEYDAAPLTRKSFNVGCVRCTERFLKHDPCLQEEKNELDKFCKKLFQDEKHLFSILAEKKWLAVAGTATYLASSYHNMQHFDAKRVHGTILGKEDLDALVDRFIALSSTDRLGLGAMDSGRADVIHAGSIILQKAMEVAKQEQVEVSTKGLRYGLILD